MGEGEVSQYREEIFVATGTPLETILPEGHIIPPLGRMIPTEGGRRPEDHGFDATAA